MAFRANKLKLVLLPLAVMSAMPVQAVDTRQVIIDRQVDLAISPEHLGHVLASPNRDFTLPWVTGAQSWWIFAKPRGEASWVDTSYLHDPSNIEVRVTYFDFDVDVPLDASAVMSQLATIKDLPVSYLVVGHADEVGTDAYNMNLSVRRAVSMLDLLVDAGVDRNSVKAIGKGNQVLSSLRNQALNRRVEIVVRGDKKTKALVEKALVAQAAQARKEKMEQDALRRAWQARPVVHPVQGAIVPPSAPVQNVERKATPAPSGSSMSATQKALLPPMRESQMAGSNPFEDGKD